MLKIPEPEQEKTNRETNGDKLLPLLEERTRIKKVLQLIQSKRQEVSEEVFLRVNADYESRLAAINREINRQARNFENTLKDYQELLECLERAVEQGDRSLEELKVRYAVGEYTREAYEAIAGDKKAKIDYYRGKIKSYRANMQRLENVISQLENG